MKKICVILFLFCYSSAFSEPIRIGSKNFTEGIILSEVLVTIAEKRGYDVERRFRVITKNLRPMFEAGEVDTYWEYTGTFYKFLNRSTAKSKPDPALQDPEKLYQYVKQAELKNGFHWLNRSQFSNSYVHLITKKAQDRLGVSTMEGLIQAASEGKKFIVGAGKNDRYRPDGTVGFFASYGINIPFDWFKNVLQQQMYLYMEQEQIDIGLGYATDPQILELNLTELKDTKNFYSPYNTAPIVTDKFFKKYPDLVEEFNKIGPFLTTKTMIKMNHAIDYGNIPLEKVAKDFLIEHGLYEVNP